MRRCVQNVWLVGYISRTKNVLLGVFSSLVVLPRFSFSVCVLVVEGTFWSKVEQQQKKEKAQKTQKPLEHAEKQLRSCTMGSNGTKNEKPAEDIQKVQATNVR